MKEPHSPLQQFDRFEIPTVYVIDQPVYSAAHAYAIIIDRMIKATENLPPITITLFCESKK